MDRRRFLKTTSAASLALLERNAFSSVAAAKKPLMIDSHVHVFKRDPAFPYAQGSHPPADDASAEQLIALMQANGVSRTVLIQVIHYKWDNRYVADVLKRYPKLFKAVCRVNPEDPAAPDTLSQLTEEGFHGVRISPAATAAGDWFTGPLMPPLWRRCAELKVPMTLLIPAERLTQAVPLIEANPELTVVIDHMADCPLDRPDLFKNLLALARYPKVFVKVTGFWTVSKQPYPYLDGQEHVKQVYQAFGAKRIMWATNWPVSLQQLPYARVVELYRDHMDLFTPQDREEVLHRSVQRIWDFGL